ncbi:MAG: pantoate--beta-alanine ligase [Chitinophagaceae bacterium]|nr:pantoate--beta-alanine ligase [Chitinophagaceae bacterium]
MIIFKESNSLSKYLVAQRNIGRTTGFVPTMGALHNGHTSLIAFSKKTCDLTVSSIFINPTQFNNPDDFKKYPITLNSDIIQLDKAGCDILFLPTVIEIYPHGFNNPPKYDIGELEFVLEGAHRHGHFQGVCQVVERLLSIVAPQKLFLGQKDFQQTLVIKKMISLTNINVDVVVGSTERLPSGLAMSSRNMRLSNQELEKATMIYQVLVYIKEHISSQPLNQLEAYAKDLLLNHGFDSVDYFSIVSLPDLKPVDILEHNNQLIAVTAATIGDVRLIDNMVVSK